MPESPVLIGESLSRFEITAKLGEGATGEVYRRETVLFDGATAPGRSLCRGGDSPSRDGRRFLVTMGNR